MLNRIINKRYVASAFCVASGLMCALAFQLDVLWWVCLVALIPFCAVMLVKKQTARGFFYCTILTVGVYHLASLTWLMEISSVIAPSVGEGASYVIMTGAILTVAMLMGIIYALPFLLLSRLRRGGLADILTVSVLYVSGELLVSLLGELAFPWARLANLALPCLPFVQSAALGGSLFVSLIVIFINCSLAFFATRLACAQRAKALISLALCMAVFASNLIYGTVALESTPKAESTDVLIVQGNYPSNDKWLAGTDEMLERYLELSEQGVTPETDIVLWPETAVPVDIDRFTNFSGRIQAFADAHKVTVAVGYIKETVHGTYNAMRLYRPDTPIDTEEYYAKQLLVPLGEFTPLSEVFGIIFPEILSHITGRELTHGDKTVVFDTDQGTVAGIICYESIQPSISLDGTRQGSGLMLMITNDSWFGTSRALWQHLSHARMRAIENGRYLARAGNSGITAVIDPSGRITSSIETYRTGYLNAKAEYLYERTLYSLIGDLPFYIGLALCIIAWIWDIIKQSMGKKCKIEQNSLAKSVQ